MRADREIKVRCSACGHLTRIPTITNADRIRAMTDKELAELLHSQFVFSNSYLPSELWLEWLKQEA